MSRPGYESSNLDKTGVKDALTQFYVGGMACAFCAATIEKGLSQVRGVSSAKVLMESGEVFIKHDATTVDKSRLKRELEGLGYYVFEQKGNMSSLILWDSSRRALRTWAFAALSLLIISPIMFPSIFSSVTIPVYYGLLAASANFAIATAVFFYFALPIHKGTIVALRKCILNEHVLYGAAGFGAYVLGILGFLIPTFRPFFFIAILLTGLHLTAGWLGARLRFNVEKSVRRLMELRPPMARVIRANTELQVSVSEVKLAELIAVKPGERIPLDGIVVDGSSEVSEAVLTGESAPLAKRVDDEVLGGSTNGSGVLTVRVTSDYENSYISRILGLVRSAKQSRSMILTFFDRIVDRVWVPLVLGIALATFTGWASLGLLQGDPTYWKIGVVNALLVAVIGYPCAIGFSAPSVGLSAFSEYADAGILVKDMSLFERLKDVKTVVFDKTGTLTYGTLKVVHTVSAPRTGFDEDALLKYAASLENESTHPAAKAIVDEAETRGISLTKCENFRQISGAGAVGLVEGKQVTIGKPELLISSGFSISEVEKALNSFPHDAKSPIIVGVDKQIVGAFDVADSLRPDAKLVRGKLKEMGLHVLMMTGDTEKAANDISKELDGMDFLARKTPEEKIELVREYGKKAGKVLMIGDGVNDAAALAAADVGVATAASIDISKDVADAVLVSSNLAGVVAMMETAKTTARASASNVLLALAFNAVGIPLAILGILTGFQAMVIMVLSLFAVFANAYLTKFRLHRRLIGKFAETSVTQGFTPRYRA